MKKKNISPFLWLLLLPIQLLADLLLIRIGTMIDLAIFSNPEAHGHGIPIFSTIFLLAAAVMTLLVFILALVLTIRGIRQQQKKN